MTKHIVHMKNTLTIYKFEIVLLQQSALICHIIFSGDLTAVCNKNSGGKCMIKYSKTVVCFRPEYFRGY